MATATLPITGTWWGHGGNGTWNESTYIWSGHDSANYRSKIAISTEGLTIVSNTRLVLEVQVSGLSSPIGLECILTQNNTIVSNNCQNQSSNAASTTLEAAAIDRSYAYADAECTTLLTTATGINMKDGDKFYLLFEDAEIMQDQTYYLYFIRKHHDGYTGTGWVQADSAEIIPTLTYTNFTVCTAPTWLKATPEIYEKEIVLTWGGAQPGENNEIIGYQLRFDHSTDMEIWDGWVELAEVTDTQFSYTPQNERGTYLRFSVRALGAAGEEYYSEWFTPEDTSAKKNSCPESPSNLKAENSLIASGDVVELSWSAATDTDGNLAGYTVRRQIDGEWVEVDNGAELTFREIRTGGAGETIQYAVRSYDQLGAVSEWVLCNDITFNSPPTAPTAIQLDRYEYSPGEAVMVSWDGAEDADDNIECYELCYELEGSNEIRPLIVIEANDINAPIESHTFAPTQLEYHQKMRIAIRAKDAFGAASDWALTDWLCRNDTPHAHIFENGTPENYVPVVAGERRMPYIRINGEWVRHPGAR